MRLRQVQFARVPAWVIEHPALQGQGMRLAVYVGLRYAAFQYPGRDWRSDRELADVIATVIGGQANTARNHLMALKAAGIVALDSGDLVLPDDDIGPQNGPVPGHGGPLAGQTANHTSTSRENTYRETTGGPQTGPGANDLTLTGQPEPTPNQLANALMVTWWKRIQTETGKPPVAVSASQFIKLTAPFFAAGYDAAAMAGAVRALHEYGTPLTRQSIERELQGRGRPRGRRTVAEQLDELRYDAKGNLVTDE